jgi:hypothetical protein
MIKRITTLALIVLSTSAYALQEKLAIDFRSPRIGAEVPPLPPGSGTPQPTNDYTNDQYTTKFFDGVGITDYDEIDPPLVWSKKYGIAQVAGPIYVWGQSPLPGPQPFLEQEDMVISGLPSITGMWLDNITNPNIFVGLRYANGLNVTGIDDGVTITFGPETKNRSEFVSFSQPVDTVSLEGLNASYAVEGFTKTDKSDPPKHVPDGGSTALLLGAGLIGLAGMKIKSALGSATASKWAGA